MDYILYIEETIYKKTIQKKRLYRGRTKQEENI